MLVVIAPTISKVAAVRIAFVKVFAVVMVNVPFTQGIRNVRAKMAIGENNVKPKNVLDIVRMVELVL